MDKKKISVLMDKDVHTQLKIIQKKNELASISSAVRFILKKQT